MRFTIATVLTLAMAVAAIPQQGGQGQGGQEHHKKPTIKDSETRCTNGNISCCINKADHENKGLLNGLLEGGLLTDLVGNRDSACASVGVLDDVSLLALTKHEEHGTVCKNVMACCPHNGGECNAISYD